MNLTSSPSLLPLRPLHSRRPRSGIAFTLVELLVVMGIIGVLVAIVVPLIPSIMRSNTMNQNVSTVSGVLEQAREAAVAQNTYVWVAFTTPVSGQPANGIWVATFQSQDGTETGINTSTTSTPNWTNTATIPGTNLQLQSKMKNLPGVQIQATSALADSLSTNLPTVLPTSLQTNLQWNVAPNSLTQGYTAADVFSQAIEFTPDGEAHTGSANAYNYIQFGLVPTIGSTTNSAAFSVSKITGHATVYRQ
jgi:prepilin-type N-terminal cleavage/methylation domain-containing protein